MRKVTIIMIFTLIALAACTHDPVSVYSRHESPVASGGGVPEVPVREKGDIKVLYVGNSQLQVNESHKIVYELSKEAPTHVPLIEYDTVYAPSETLKGHWETGTVQQKLKTGDFDFIVLQGFYQTDDASLEAFRLYGTKLCMEAEKYGTVPIIFSYSVSNIWFSTKKLHNKHVSLLNLVDKARPALTALGYENYFDPSVGNWGEFDRGDGHPNFRGSYMYSLTLFMAITGFSPVGLKYVPDGSVTNPTKYQQAAYDAYLESKKRPYKQY